MSTEDLLELIREYPLPEGWIPLHRFALRFFEHYRMAPGQLVPNGWRKLAGLIYLWAKIIPLKPIPAGLSIPPLPPAIPSVSSAETVPLEMASGSGKSQHGGFLGILQKAKGKQKDKQPSVELPPAPKKTRVTPPERSPRILDQVSIDDDPIFRPRWTLKMMERVKKRAVEEVTKARDQGIRDFLDENTGDEWLKKRTEDGLEIYELVVSPSGETAMPSEAGDAAASHLPGEGLSGDAPGP
ncbi:hypothetical protein RJ640_006845 [Escallonia rubra]|uniref:Transposase (putative) gypsy type domain-containing protein n=1 Tax=Escallonia rubra TaxID=112253 RepID=A0AA88SM04_9ASTE|nr:hypothetical protein RJ640_006845 [Escallonia rubra]